MADGMLRWVLFNLFVLGMLAVDLGVFHHKAREVKLREALGWTAAWVGLALLFNLGIYAGWVGNTPPEARSQRAVEFLTGYLIEKSLSVDNIFVFLLIFTYFRVPAIYQHKVLFWGVLGALLMRAIFILTGVALIHKFHWIIYIFGVFLIATGVKMALQKDRNIHPERNSVLRLFRRGMPVTEDYVDDRFFMRRDARWHATPLLVTLLVVESTDVVFAVDSIPAILAVTRDPFIVYTSNVFAMMGLRALYFALGGILRLFHHLHYGVSAILVFVGAKMLVSDLFKIPIGISLGVIGTILAISVVASMLSPRTAQTTAQAGGPAGSNRQ
jgi:tellurite resistance protein TerC